jgi:hypothetical protein
VLFSISEINSNSIKKAEGITNAKFRAMLILAGEGEEDNPGGT